MDGALRPARLLSENASKHPEKSRTSESKPAVKQTSAYCKGKHWYKMRKLKLELFEFFSGLLEQVLVEQTCEKPGGSIVQPDNAAKVPFCFTVIPRAGVPFLQQCAGGIFRGIDAEHIDGAAIEGMVLVKLFTHWRKARGKPVDRKHPDGRMAGQLFVLAFEQRADSGPHTFHAPAGCAAE